MYDKDSPDRLTDNAVYTINASVKVERHERLSYIFGFAKKQIANF